MNLAGNKKFPVCDVSVFSGSNHNAVSPPLTGRYIFKRLDGDTILKAYPSAYYQNSDNYEIERVEVVKKNGKRTFDTLSKINTSDDTSLNKTRNISAKVS